MDFAIDNGFCTEYISTLFLALFFEKTMIERCLLLENNSSNRSGSYLQEIIQYL